MTEPDKPGNPGKPRGVLIAGNWKMNHGLQETSSFFSVLRAQWNERLSRPTGLAIQEGKVRVLAFPPFLSIGRALKEVSGLPVEIGAQNAHWKDKGAFTGEVSGPMLREFGIKTVLVGHSERRQHFGETDDSVRQRADGLLSQGFLVVMCIGETRQERESGRTVEVLNRQLAGALPEPGKGAAAYLDGRLVIAYEPVWAIGTGLTATPAQAEEAHQLVRRHLWDRFGIEAAGRTLILYGGSVTSENIDALLACPNLDGALVGGASLKPESFLALIEGGGKAAARA